MLNTFNHHGDTNQNYTEILHHPNKNELFKKENKRLKTAEKDLEKKELLYNLFETVNYYSLCGIQYRVCSKSLKQYRHIIQLHHSSESL
jgi:beta-phosphoglucomutase-like phosphatase (HAD superfamily)